MCFFVADETMPLGGEPAVGNDASCCEEWLGRWDPGDRQSLYFFSLLCPVSDP